jgi:6-phosphogluconolactonase
MTRLTTCQEAEAVAARAAAFVRREIDRARAERGTAHVALSGGTTPARTYELLGTDGGDWSGVEVWFADERCVAPDDDESNYRLAAENLLCPAGIARERVHRMQGELGPERGAVAYAEELAAHAPAVSPGAAGPVVLDLIVLGIGPDGHVCSLFPGAATLQAPGDALCLPVFDSPKPPSERITLTLGVLHAARGCLLLATGASKSDAVSAMLADPSESVPASLLRRERLSVIIDDAAAPPAPRTA